MMEKSRHIAFLSDPANKKLVLELEIRKRRIEKRYGCEGVGSPEASCEFDIYRKLALANVPLKFWDNEVNDIERPNVKIVVAKYISNIDIMWRKGWGLFVYGGNGTGKSMLASIILKEAIKRGYLVYFTSLSEVLQKYCDAMYNQDARRDFEEDFLSADFIVLDDVDKAYKNQKTFIDSAYDYLFRTRANRMLPIIVTSNLGREDLVQKDGEQQTFGRSLLSLFNEHLHDLCVRGMDRRQMKLKKEMEAFFNGS